jgi:hypothetical protein
MSTDRNYHLVFECSFAACGCIDMMMIVCFSQKVCCLLVATRDLYKINPAR